MDAATSLSISRLASFRWTSPVFLRRMNSQPEARLFELAKEDHIAIWGDHQTLWLSLWQGHRAATDEGAIRPALSFKEVEMAFLFRRMFQVKRLPHLYRLFAVFQLGEKNSPFGAQASLPVWLSHTATLVCSP